MSNAIGANTARNRKTRFHTFFSCNPQQDALFAVNGNLDVDEALQIASCMLASANGVATSMAEEIDSNAAWAVQYLLEMSSAIVDAAIAGMRDEKKSGSHE